MYKRQWGILYNIWMNQFKPVCQRFPALIEACRQTPPTRISLDSMNNRIAIYLEALLCFPTLQRRQNKRLVSEINGDGTDFTESLILWSTLCCWLIAQRRSSELLMRCCVKFTNSSRVSENSDSTVFKINQFDLPLRTKGKRADPKPLPTEPPTSPQRAWPSHEGSLLRVITHTGRFGMPKFLQSNP